MRIQHNIMAMNAYRNYNKNTSALSKNLEKLSSGYKINRAGDDAAGLAISEKMRAQITGLEAAQKNVKDGISLVNTSEGAMQEIQDMLNRMVYLATESANGTYDNEVDRKNLQQEVDQLRSEINRIADSANFNGIKLLDGSLDTESKGTVAETSAITNVTTGAYSPAGKSEAFEATYITNRPPAATAQTNGEFTVSFDDIAVAAPASGTASLTIKIGDKQMTIKASAAKKALTGADIAKAIMLQGKKKGSLAKSTDGATAAASKSDTASWKASYIGLSAASGTQAGSFFEIDGHYYEATRVANGNSITFTQVDFMGTSGEVVHPDYEVSVTKGNGNLTGTTNWHVQNTKTGAGVGSSHQAQVKVDIDFSKLKDGDTLTVGDKSYIFKVGANSTTAATGGQTLINLSAIFKTEADLADAKKQALALDKIVDDMAGANSTTWSAGNGGVANGKGTLTFQSLSTYTDDNTDIGGSATAGKCNMSTEASVMKQFFSNSKAADANVSFELDVTKLKEGDTITIDGTTFEFTDGTHVSDKANVAVNLKSLGFDGGLLSSQTGDVMNALKTAINNTLNNGYAAGTSNLETKYNITIDENKMTLTSKDNATTANVYENRVSAKIELSDDAYAGRALTLQIGDTSDDFNQLAVSVKDMHTKSLGIDGINIGTAEGAKAAINVIKDAINSVSEVRGKLGAISNRLDHTSNNLSVMRENIQDAESSIRDTDVAEEMMSYTKNNIFNLRKEDKINQRVKKPVFMRLCGEVALGCEECLAA